MKKNKYSAKQPMPKSRLKHQFMDMDSGIHNSLLEILEKEKPISEETHDEIWSYIHRTSETLKTAIKVASHYYDGADTDLMLCALHYSQELNDYLVKMLDAESSIPIEK